MERKSAWSLLMSEQQIVNEYKEAKSPRNQIAILADQNMCDKKTIVNILEAAGCEVPGYYKKKTKDPEAAAEVFDEIAEETQKLQQEQEAPKQETPKDVIALTEALPIMIQASALDAIEALLKEADESNTGTGFRENVRGVLALVREVCSLKEA